MKERYFLTVDRCSRGKRGIFCSREGGAFLQDEPHSEDKVWGILGSFALVLSPQSIKLSAEELKAYTQWYPLAEFSNQYGYALKKEDTDG